MHVTDSWPAGLAPAEVPVYAYNELRTPLPAERLWPVLLRAGTWPTWYDNARDVVLDDGGEVLTGSSTFTWTTFGMRVRSTVRELTPHRRLGWEGRGRGSFGYHRWDLTPTEDGGTLVVTEEVQTGLLARLLGRVVKRSIERQHQRWLEALVERAGSATP